MRRSPLPACSSLETRRPSSALLLDAIKANRFEKKVYSTSSCTTPQPPLLVHVDDDLADAAVVGCPIAAISFYQDVMNVESARRRLLEISSEFTTTTTTNTTRREENYSQNRKTSEYEYNLRGIHSTQNTGINSRLYLKLLILAFFLFIPFFGLSALFHPDTLKLHFRRLLQPSEKIWIKKKNEDVTFEFSETYALGISRLSSSSPPLQSFREEEVEIPLESLEAKIGEKEEVDDIKAEVVVPLISEDDFFVGKKSYEAAVTEENVKVASQILNMDDADKDYSTGKYSPGFTIIKEVSVVSNETGLLDQVFGRFFKEKPRSPLCLLEENECIYELKPSEVLTFIFSRPVILEAVKLGICGRQLVVVEYLERASELPKLFGDSNSIPLEKSSKILDSISVLTDNWVRLFGTTDFEPYETGLGMQFFSRESWVNINEAMGITRLKVHIPSNEEGCLYHLAFSGKM